MDLLVPFRKMIYGIALDLPLLDAVAVYDILDCLGCHLPCDTLETELRAMEVPFYAEQLDEVLPLSLKSKWRKNLEDDPLYFTAPNTHRIGKWKLVQNDS